MSDRLFVTLWTLGGFMKEWVEFSRYDNQRPFPDFLEHDGTTYKFMGVPSHRSFMWSDGGLEEDESEENPVYMEVGI